MRDLDKMIEDALGEEEADVLRRIGGEPGLVERAMDMFGAGPQWMVRFLLFAQTLLFVAGVWAAWKFFAADDPVSQLRWGLPAAVLVLVSLIVKMGVGPVVYHNRVMRELKRIELQIARTPPKV